MSGVVNKLLIGVATLLLAAGCASATQPALRSGDAELSRSELIDAVQQLGVPVLPVVNHAEFDVAASLLAIDMQIEDRFSAAGVVLTAEDYEAFNAANVTPDFDIESLPPLSRLDYELTVKVTALAAATGVPIEDLVTDMYAQVEIDPRYGTIGLRGLVPPAAP